MNTRRCLYDEKQQRRRETPASVPEPDRCAGRIKTNPSAPLPLIRTLRVTLRAQLRTVMPKTNTSNGGECLQPQTFFSMVMMAMVL